MKKHFDLGLACKPDFMRCIDRVYAWYEQQVIDRVPVRFSEHNAMYNVDLEDTVSRFESVKAYWYDVDYQIEAFEATIRDKTLYGETFPVYFPNLGPGVYASYYGCELDFSATTSWTKPIIDDISRFDFSRFRLDTQNEYGRKIEELTDAALQACPGKFMVDYTDLHPSVDCLADWYGSEKLCVDMIMQPEAVKKAADAAYGDFERVFSHYHQKLSEGGQISSTWMAIPTYEPMHIPSCDFSTLISQEMFNEFCLPYVKKEVALAKYNIFHVDGPGVMKHIDALLTVPNIQAYQIVQGVAEDEPIMQWVPLIKKIQAAGKSLVISLKLEELESFIDAVSPEGMFLTLAADYELQPDILKRLEKWT